MVRAQKIYGLGFYSGYLAGVGIYYWGRTIIFLITALPVVGELRRALLVILAVIACADFTHIIIKMPRDERDRMHEAIAERNALWAILAVLTIGIGYQAGVSAAHGANMLTPSLLLLSLLVSL